RWSGGEVALYNLVTHLPAQIEPLVVLAEEGPLAERFRSAGVPVTVMPLDPDIRNVHRNDLGAMVGGSVHMIRYGLRVGRVLREARVDLIQTNSLKAALYGAQAGWLAGAPVIWDIRDILSPPYVRPGIARVLRGLARTVPAGLLTNSQATTRALGLPANFSRPVRAVPSGYAGPLGRLATGRDLSGRDPSAPFTAVLVGRLAPWKGQHVFLEAVKLLRERRNDLRFWIAGDALFGEDDYKSRLQKTVRRERLDSVVFLGHVDDVPALLRRADLLVHTSVTPEPFGQVIVEGMAAGLPVLATNAGGPTEIVVDGVTGRLLPPGDPRALAEALEWMADHPAERAAMGEAGLRRVQERFTIEATVKGVLELYDEVLKAKGRQKA
ncbi:MAG: glycosyltransferase, partial [Kyrpidia sp.]|nr:glycosyltransferase [Kyrpidia sp.]